MLFPSGPQKMPLLGAFLFYSRAFWPLKAKHYFLHWHFIPTFTTVIKRLVNNLPYVMLGLLIILVVAITISNGLHYDYHDYSDDIGFIAAFHNYGILGGTWFMLTDCNGRLVSHFLTVWLLPIVTTNKPMLVGFYLVNVVMFVAALSWFLKQFFAYRYSVQLSNGNAVIAGCVFYSLFFFFFFAKRFEFWFWLSDIFIYEYSLILILLLMGVLLRGDKSNRAGLLIAMLSACIGFMSETQAATQLLILGFLLIYRWRGWAITLNQEKWKLVSAAIIATALVVNYIAPGTAHKLKISKTHATGANNYAHGLAVLAKDLSLNWDRIKINSAEPIYINAIFVQAICILLLLLLSKFFVEGKLNYAPQQLPIKGFIPVIVGAAFIVLLTYLVPAILYANVLDFVVDRCKLIGCFFTFLAFFDMAIMFVLFFKKKRQA